MEDLRAEGEGSFTMALRQVRLVALAAALLLAGCSWVPNAVNPVHWYRSLSGADKNDALDKGAPNQQNLEAGGKEPYPNLADVPDTPTNATSTIDRDALQKSLVADRSNAQYTDEQLRAGIPAGEITPAPPPAAAAAAAPAKPQGGGAATEPATSQADGPAPVAAQQQAAPAAPAPPESALASPAIPNLPQGQSPDVPPPRPSVAPAGTPAATPTQPVQTASLPPGQRRAAAPSPPIAAFNFTAGSTSLSDQVRTRLSEIAAAQHKDGGSLRVVGHAAESNDDSAEQKLESFTLALNRAKAVADALGSEGVPQKSIEVEAVPGPAGGAGTEIFLEH
jgi:outer membrane protein OmpA-like peptidoglycan-associated protein